VDSRESRHYKRLAVVVDTFPRWSERFIARELSELRRRGVNLTVFCLKAGDDPPFGDPEWNGLLERRVVLPSCILPRGFVLDGDADMRRRQEAAREALGATFYSKFGCALKFAELLREGKFQHVHAHFANLPSTIGWLAATAAKIPFSMSVHARDLFVEPQALAEKAADAVCIFACHARATGHLGKIESAAQKTVHMHHGLSLDQFKFRDRTIGESVRILAAGRFVPKKGFQYAVQALLDSRLAECNVTLALAGDGPGRKRIEALVKELKLEKRVQFVAPGDAAAVKIAFESAHAFLAPYESAPDGDSDGIPNVILESFALGVPVIGTDAGSLNEILTPETGCVVAQKNSAAIADAIVAVLDKPTAAARRARTARTLVENQFDIGRNIEPLLAMLTLQHNPQ
jgi:glycosyltransferase involved in cell wall biosynthesis